MAKSLKTIPNKTPKEGLRKSLATPTLTFLTLPPLSTLAEYKDFLFLVGLILFIIVIMVVFTRVKRIKVWFFGTGVEVEGESSEKSPEKVGIKVVGKIQSQGPVIGQQEIGQARDIYQGPVTFQTSPELEERVKRLEETVRQLSPAPPKEEIERQYDADTLKKQLAASVLQNSRLNMELGLERLKDKQYEEAIENLREALKPLPEESEAAASILWNLGIALVEWPKGNRFDNLKNALEAYNKILRVYTREKSPEDFAGAQNNLGNAYSDLAGVRDREKNLGLAIAAYKKALRVFTFDAFPKDYAATQNNLGNAYNSLAGVRDKEGNLKLAIEGFKKALKVCALDSFPQYYAMTQNNLGNAYCDLADVSDTEGNLAHAIESYKQALKVYTADTFPLERAEIYNNLGVAYSDFARVKDYEKNLKLAIAAYNESIKVYTMDVFPLKYVAIQNNLGTAYCDLARIEKEQKEETLLLAIDAFIEVLKVCTLNEFPAQYAMTQNNLGAAYMDLASVGNTETNLKKAAHAYNEALTVRTFDAFPVDYASTQFNIGLLYLFEGEMYAERRHLKHLKESLKLAETAFTESIAIFKKEKMDEWVKRAEENLTDVRNLLSQIK